MKMKWSKRMSVKSVSWGVRKRLENKRREKEMNIEFQNQRTKYGMVGY